MKNSRFYANDATRLRQVLPQLQRKMMDDHGMNWAVLVDGAFDYPTKTPEIYSRGINCYKYPTLSGLERAAPWIVEIESNTSGFTLLETLIRHCSGRPMCSIVSSRSTISSLANQWASLHWVTDSDAQRMLLRFADTRVLGSLSRVLTNQQWAAYCTCIEEWLYFDRQGNLASCTPPKQISSCATEICLDSTQMEELLSLAEPDLVIDFLYENMSDIIPGNLRNSELQIFVKNICDQARLYSIDTFSDLIGMVVAACLTEGASMNDRRMITLLERRSPWHAGELNAAIVSSGII